MHTTNDDITLKDYNDNISSTNGDLNLTRCNGNFSTTNGDIDLKDCQGNVSTTNGNIDVENCIMGSVNSTNGDIDLYNSNIDYVKTTNGTISLNNSKIKECTGYDIKGNGEIEHLILPVRNGITKINNKFNIFNPNTWFSNCIQTISSSNSINIQIDGDISIINDKIYVNGKEITKGESKPKIWTVPKEIKIKRITTLMDIKCPYDIEIDGGGKLIK